MHSQSGVISLHNAFVTLDSIASSIFFNYEANHYIKGVGGGVTSRAFFSTRLMAVTPRERWGT